MVVFDACSDMKTNRSVWWTFFTNGSTHGDQCFAGMVWAKGNEKQMQHRKILNINFVSSALETTSLHHFITVTVTDNNISQMRACQATALKSKYSNDALPLSTSMASSIELTIIVLQSIWQQSPKPVTITCVVVNRNWYFLFFRQIVLSFNFSIPSYITYNTFVRSSDISWAIALSRSIRLKRSTRWSLWQGGFHTIRYKGGIISAVANVVSLGVLHWPRHWVNREVHCGFVGVKKDYN